MTSRTWLGTEKVGLSFSSSTFKLNCFVVRFTPPTFGPPRIESPLSVAETETVYTPETCGTSVKEKLPAVASNAVAEKR
eukprot:752073-Hanusia_phi.AAC.8